MMLQSSALWLLLAIVCVHSRPTNILIINNGSPSQFLAQRFVSIEPALELIPTNFASHYVETNQELSIPIPPDDYLTVGLFQDGEFIFETLPWKEGQVYDLTINEGRKDFQLQADPSRTVPGNATAVVFPPFFPSEYPFFIGIMWKHPVHGDFYWSGMARVVPNSMTTVMPTFGLNVTSTETSLSGCHFDFDDEQYKTHAVVTYTTENTWNCDSY
eukprot:TRINITY_DN4788_c0_g1_i1.p1 TRINITY_DN4788_c0_g1~~TRINITY_DN4788_c0_g1_i1.p1  ORF type:complete len:215 (-),score=43.91 TRINITY_DN4788_c0_g1_i1:14-658(-)